MKDNTVGVFFALLRTGLWADTDLNLDVLEAFGTSDQSRANFNEKVDWVDVYRLATEQSVLGLVLAGIERYKNLFETFGTSDKGRANTNLDLNIPQELLLQWIGEIQMLEQQNKEMNGFIGVLVDKMRNAGIYTLLVKGQGIAQCYDRPLWRSCGDVDLFLSDDNYEKAKDYLAPLASHVDKEGIASKHLGMTIDSWVVELHGTMHCGLSTRIDKTLDKIKEDIFYRGDARSWMNGKTQVYLPGADSDIIIVFTHYLKHFYKGGLGIRQICDWSRLLWTYRESIKIDLLKKHLSAMGLASEWKAFGAFAVDYLGMPSEAMPLYDSSARWHRKADKICKFVMAVGNFGHNRDLSYYGKKSYLMQKIISFGQRTGDLIHHANIFPLDSMRFFPKIVINGLISAVRGE